MNDNLDLKQLDSDRINLNERWEVRYWCRVLGVTEEKLRTAVMSVGVMVSDVKHFLGK
jgi:hypothetical protein